MQKRRVGVWLVVSLVAGGLLAAGEQVGPPGSPPAGVADFVAARLLESNGRYREALKSYERALQLDPDVLEIRVRYAALLLEVGLSQRAVEILGTGGELDWYGRRVRALAWPSRRRSMRRSSPTPRRRSGRFSPSGLTMQASSSHWPRSSIGRVRSPKRRR
jgi:hypothetical protein